MQVTSFLALATGLAGLPLAEDKREVQVVRGMAYVAGKDADPVRHRLTCTCPGPERLAGPALRPRRRLEE